MRLRLLFALLLALTAAAPARAAETVLLADDMEGAIDAKWVVGEPENAAHEPWQLSDSTAPKVRGNQANGGATSYWAGPAPEGMHPADVYDGEITLTSKESIIVPADGKTTVSFWSLFQNEGDDSGSFEVALADNATGKNAWKRVAAVKLVSSDVTNPEYVPGYCTPNPGTATAGFEEITGDLAAYAGKEILVRFKLEYGSENRASSFPCGWYVDDLAIKTTGTPGQVASVEPVAGPAPAAPAAKPAVKLRGLKAKGKRARVKLTVTGSDVADALLTLLKGKRKVARVKLGALAPGTRTVTLKLRRKLRRGRYVLRLSGTGADGTRVSASRRARIR